MDDTAQLHMMGDRIGPISFTIELPVQVVRQPVNMVADNEMDELLAMLHQRNRKLLGNFMTEGWSPGLPEDAI